MKFTSKILTVILILGFGIFSLMQLKKSISSENISKEHQQVLIEQESAKTKRKKVSKENFDRYQDYLNTFIGTNIKEIESELIKESWKKENIRFTSVHGDTITIEHDEYDTITNVELKVNQITKIITN